MNLLKIFRVFTKLLGTTIFHPQFFSKRFLNQQIKNHSKILSGNLLDVGCGAGPYKQYFTQSNYIGLDYPNYDKDIPPNNALNIAGNVMFLPFKDGSFDGLICTQVLEHVPKPWEAVVQMGRVLKPGGKLLLTVPFFYPLHDEPYDYFRFTSHGVGQLISEAGFKILESIPQKGFVKMAGEFFNLYCIHQISNLLNFNIWTQLLGLCIIPVFLIVAIIINILVFLLSFFDKGERFTMNYFILAKKV